MPLAKASPAKLLKIVFETSALEAENENLKKKVQILASRGAKTRDYSDKSGSSPHKPEFRGMKTTYRPKVTKYSGQLGDISSIVGKLHDCIAIESQEIATRNVETECVVGLEAMRNVIDLGAEGVGICRTMKWHARNGYKSKLKCKPIPKRETKH